MVRAEDLVVETFFVGPLQMRCSVVCDTSTGDTVVIDAGDEPDRLIAWNDEGEGTGPNWSSAPGPVRAGDRTVVALLNTHAHFDHSGHIPTVREHWGVEWWLHPDDTFLQSLAQQSAARWGFPPLPEPAEADHDLAHAQTVDVGSLTFEVLHTPGHTLGGVCLLLRVEGAADHLFVGDTLFAGSVGRTDLPNTGGDFQLLAKSIHTHLWPLEGDTVVHPGHGPLTTIGHERETNPFVGVGAGEHGTYGRGKYA